MANERRAPLPVNEMNTTHRKCTSVICITNRISSGGYPLDIRRITTGGIYDFSAQLARWATFVPRKTCRHPSVYLCPHANSSNYIKNIENGRANFNDTRKIDQLTSWPCRIRYSLSSNFCLEPSAQSAREVLWAKEKSGGIWGRRREHGSNMAWLETALELTKLLTLIISSRRFH